MALFEKGHNRGGGRKHGARNRLSTDLIEALAQDFREHGMEAVRICRIEKPNEYLKIVASLIPRELEITDSRLKEISDDELERLIELTRAKQIDIGGSDYREESAVNGKQAPVLQALPKAN